MIRLIAFLKARRGMSRAQFVDYYEQHHVPLILGIAPQIADYRRNYLELPPMRDIAGGDPASCDVVTELCFVDEAAYTAAMQALLERREDIRADEARFLDTDAIRLFRADARDSPI